MENFILWYGIAWVIIIIIGAAIFDKLEDTENK